jgi:50S ribosomal protein uL3
MEQTNTLIKGIKLEMSQIFGDNGLVVPVTRVVTEDALAEDLVNKAVEVVGTSKGKGFAGVMKKWHFKGSMATRGQSTEPRKPGAIGSQTPGRVLKGKKMAGRMGNNRVTVKGIKIVQVNLDKHEILVSGPLPGSRNSEVKIKVLG